jgi:hypothetical protein
MTASARVHDDLAGVGHAAIVSPRPYPLAREKTGACVTGKIRFPLQE